MNEAEPLDVAGLDSLPAAHAAPLLESCCGSAAWVRGMLRRRPFRSVEGALTAAKEVWWALGPEDWHEAFAHHPRIGERTGAAAQNSRARGWSEEEQRGVADADARVRDALAEGNREYERRFGHIYLVCAAGKPAAELLEMLRGRLANDAASELRVAAGEQAKITELRLRRLLGAS